MSVKQYVVNGATDGPGDATVDTPTTINGELLAVFVEGIALTDGADLVVTTRMPLVDGSVATGETVINNGDVGNAAMNAFYPRRAAEDNTGTDLVYASTDVVPVPYVVPGCQLRAVVANGGASKAFRITYVARE